MRLGGLTKLALGAMAVLAGGSTASAEEKLMLGYLRARPIRG